MPRSGGGAWVVGQATLASRFKPGLYGPLVERLTVEAVRPDGTLDPTFGTPAPPVGLRVSVPLQRARTAFAREVLRVTIGVSDASLVKLRAVAGGTVIAGGGRTDARIASDGDDPGHRRRLCPPANRSTAQGDRRGDITNPAGRHRHGERHRAAALTTCRSCIASTGTGALSTACARLGDRHVAVDGQACPRACPSRPVDHLKTTTRRRLGRSAVDVIERHWLPGRCRWSVGQVTIDRDSPSGRSQRQLPRKQRAPP